MKYNKVFIIYFSATGNTKWVCDEIKKHVEAKGYKIKLLSAENVDKIETTDFSDALLGIAFPCYAFDYPDVMDKALKAIDLMQEKAQAFILTTYCISDGASRKNISEKLAEKNYEVIYSRGFKCPSSGFYNIKSGLEKGIKKLMIDKVTRFDQHINEKILSCAENIMEIMASDKHRKPAKFKPAFFADIPKLYAKWNESRIFRGYVIDESKCILCNICLNNCPTNNFEIINGKMNFKDENECLRCMRCISNCSKDAITLGEKTKGKLRYNFADRERLIDNV